MRHFYSHIVEIESVLVSLDELELSDEQKKHLASLIDSTIHKTILDVILSKLSGEDKKQFLYQLNQNPGDRKLMEFLSQRIDNIEMEIKKVVKDLKNELHEDLKEARRLKGAKYD